MKRTQDSRIPTATTAFRNTNWSQTDPPTGSGRRRVVWRAVLLALLGSGPWLTLPAEAQFNRTELRSFCDAEEMGLQPFAGLIQGSDGALYGTTMLGAGSTESQGIQGTVFKVNPDGSGYRVLHRFIGLETDGTSPYGGLIEGRDQLLYGTTYSGGNARLGTVFRLSKDGSDYRILHHFAGGGTDGANPYTGLIESSDGTLLGTTHYGGSSNLGTIFQLNPDGGGFSVLHSFTATGGSQVLASAPLIEDAGKQLYGTTRFGGAFNLGTAFRFDRITGNHQVLLSFRGTNGAEPYARLLRGNDGLLYGTTSSGGASNRGAVFRVDKDGNNPAVIHSFTGSGGGGSYPYGSLIQGIDGALYGTTAIGGASNQGTIFRLDTSGTALTNLHHFTLLPTDGSNPYAGLTPGNDGLLYGTTYIGGSRNFGTVFKLAPDGNAFAVVRSFLGENGDAANPYANVVEGSDQILYGTTWFGGAANAGSVFRINRDGTGFSVLRSFLGAGTDGANPYARLIEASDQMLYGTTTAGGRSNLGTVFRMNRDGGGYTNLHSFVPTANSGWQPYGPVLEGADTLLYGTTPAGGASGVGTLFRMNRTGGAYTVLYTFTGTAASGANPYGGLIQGSNGTLYGTTANGGTSNLGTIFRIAASGAAPTVMRSFTGAGGDGANSYTGLFRASDGLLYGTTARGGTNNLGTIFKLSTNGSGYTVIHRFTGTGGGANPSANGTLIEGVDGALYGTTDTGGTANFGTVFRINRDGTGHVVLFSFTAQGNDGAQPYAGLARGKDGALYATTVYGGSGCGTLLRIEPAATFSIGADKSTSLSGPAGYRFLVQSLGNLQPPGPWQDLTNVTLLDTPTPVPDPAAGTAEQRIYRAVLNP